MTKLRPGRWARWALAAGIAAVVFYFLPLFRVVPLESARQQALDASFDSESFVETFWHQRLLEADASAVDAAHLIRTLRADPAGAGRLGRRLGLGRTVCFFVSGSGEIQSIEANAVSIRIEGDSDEASVIIETGPVFGNAIRDGAGLLDVSAFPNSRDFNAISTALNRRVEAEVLPAFQHRARVGARVHFLGCAEVDDLGSALPLRIVPIRIEWP
jgi:predicted lipoprotein